MSVCDLLKECEQSGVSVYLVNGSVKASGKREAVSKYAPLLKTHKAEIERHLSNPKELNALFRFDLMQDEIAAGQSGEELKRVNNMAWEFMQVDGMAFEDAITLAAQIIISGQKSACEAAYADVMALFKRLENLN